MNVEKYSQHSYNARYDRADGRLFVVVHSQATSFNDFTRVYSYAIFDLAGNVIAGQAQHYKSAATARKHCADMLALLDADQLTLDALSYLEGRFANDISYARQKWTPALEDAA